MADNIASESYGHQQIGEWKVSRRSSLNKFIFIPVDIKISLSSHEAKRFLVNIFWKVSINFNKVSGFSRKIFKTNDLAMSKV